MEKDEVMEDKIIEELVWVEIWASGIAAQENQGPSEKIWTAGALAGATMALEAALKARKSK